MTLFARILVPDEGSHANERELAHASFTRLSDARDWAARNRLTWLGALEKQETCFEMWVEDDNQKKEVVFAIRYALTRNGDGDVIVTKRIKKEGVAT